MGRVVSMAPLICGVARIEQRSEPMRVKKFGSDARVERFDKSVLSWLSRLNKEKLNAMFFRPELHDLRRQLGAVVDPQIFRLAVGPSDFVEHVDYRLAWERIVEFKREAAATKFVHHRQATKGTSVKQPIVNEVERPTLEGSRCPT